MNRGQSIEKNNGNKNSKQNQKSSAVQSTANRYYMTPQRKFRMLDLFSGIGGFALAAQWVWGKRLEIVSFCEIDKFCQKILNKHWPKVPIHDDIKYLDGNDWRGTVDLIVGGFPCQPFSVAGKQKSQKDDRYLWPEMLRVITQTQPTWVVGENVAGIINLELDKVLADLEGASYETITFNIPACAVDAPHKRERIWIVGYADRNGCNGAENKQGIDERSNRDKRGADKMGKLKRTSGLRNADVPNSNGKHGKELFGKYKLEKAKATFGWGDCEYGGEWKAEPGVGRVVNGIPNRVDRIKGLGNAVVPQVAAQILGGVALLDVMQCTMPHNAIARARTGHKP